MHIKTCEAVTNIIPILKNNQIKSWFSYKLEQPSLWKFSLEFGKKNEACVQAPGTHGEEIKKEEAIKPLNWHP